MKQTGEWPQPLPISFARFFVTTEGVFAALLSFLCLHCALGFYFFNVGGSGPAGHLGDALEHGAARPIAFTGGDRFAVWRDEFEPIPTPLISIHTVVRLLDHRYALRFTLLV